MIKRTLLLILGIGIAAASIAATVFLLSWSPKKSTPAPKNETPVSDQEILPETSASDTEKPVPVFPDIVNNTPPDQQSIAAAVKEPPQQKSPDGTVHISLPDSDIVVPSAMSSEKFKSNDDEEEETDDEITVETESDDE
jgi:type IV secretory pathway VirB10-like protein